jgi:hypothetical protein
MLQMIQPTWLIRQGMMLVHLYSAVKASLAVCACWGLAKSWRLLERLA